MDAGITVRGQATAQGGQSGFTLIELVIVIAILSVLSVGALLAVGRVGGGASGDAATFRALYDANRRLAVQGQNWRGLRVEQGGTRTAVRGADGWQSAPTLRRWRDRVAFRHAVPVPGDRLMPDIVFLPNGQTSAFSIQFAARGRDPSRRSLRCGSDGWTGLRCDAE
ncbi:type II secretion system protein [Sulfitobacter sabulilitoris]|uniref:Type II secretion system protein n=1 Tax=Sulfitobacter sabulilitoris TaxID=2562655 RepID=A0A5S3PC83_9RHOB|nr:type II secretion system protein [Sulfitobacter sabulilitoris]TMM51306.1 type II secretion system protein [Sulfitobacter sabulilitoris]